MCKLAPGYALTREQLVNITSLMIGMPVTYEHSGIFDAIKNLNDRNEAPLQTRVWKELNNIASTKDIRSSAIGQVVDYWESPNGSWWCTFYISASKWEGVVWMVEKLFLRGLSLTHMIHSENIVPYEVSLCFEPARPGCYVYFLHVDLFRVDEYKRDVMSKSIREPITQNHTPAVVIMSNKSEDPTAMDTTSTEITTPVVQKPLIEQAMEGLPEEHRSIIAARLSEMCKRTDDALAAKKTAEEERDIAKKAKEIAIIQAKNGEVNVGMLKSQLDIMRDNLGQELISNYHITAEHCAPLLESNDPNDVRRVVDRVLLAANAKMMMASQNANSISSSSSSANDDVILNKKRKPESQQPDTNFKVPQTAHITGGTPMVAASKKKVVTKQSDIVTTSSPEDILRRALADTFEC